MDRYYYNGPVMCFGKCIGNWSGETVAKSISDARKNLTYQCKKKLNLNPGTKVELVGKITT